MNTKAMTIDSVDEAGEGLARLAQLSAVDSDGDTYAPGAFSWKAGGGQWVQMIPAHNRRAMPFGKAWVYEEGDWALAKFYLNLGTVAGREWYSALKFDLEKGLSVQEWSFGYNVIDADFQIRRDGAVRVLKRLDVDEFSPVLRGAGVNTGTIGLKSARLKDDHYSALIGGLGELAAALPDDAAIVSATGLKQLREIHGALGAALAKTVEDQVACARCEAKFAPAALENGHCGPCREVLADGKSLEDQALAGLLLHLSRHHLPPS